MENNLKLKVEVIASKGFVQAVSRLAESRTLNLKDHAAVVRLAKTTQSTINKLKKIAETPDADLAPTLSEMVDMEGCLLSNRVITEAGLSPADSLALDEIISQG